MKMVRNQLNSQVSTCILFIHLSYLPSEEKITLSYDDVQLRLSISSAGKVYDARGSLFLSNKRVCLDALPFSYHSLS